MTEIIYEFGPVNGQNLQVHRTFKKMEPFVSQSCIVMTSIDCKILKEGSTSSTKFRNELMRKP